MFSLSLKSFHQYHNFFTLTAICLLKKLVLSFIKNFLASTKCTGLALAFYFCFYCFCIFVFELWASLCCRTYFLISEMNLVFPFQLTYFH